MEQRQVLRMSELPESSRYQDAAEPGGHEVHPRGVAGDGSLRGSSSFIRVALNGRLQFPIGIQSMDPIGGPIHEFGEPIKI
jgi:hypothetical protein